MIRGPDEIASRTLERLRLSVQKKVGGGGGGRRTTRRKKATRKARDRKGGKKGTAEEETGGDDVDDRDDDERVVTRLLWKEGKIREGYDDASSSADATKQRPTSSSGGDDDEVTAAAACIAFWETFSDFVLPIDPCNPWNTAIVGEKKDRNSSSAGEKSATNRAADQSDTGADDDGIGGIIADGGYEVADDIDANSLTIDELLRRAMTDDSGSGGMNGLDDMVNALRWIRCHVGNFGGDPNRVTLFGQGVGSASVCYLAVMNPRATGLFHRGILQSGECVVGDDRPDSIGLVSGEEGYAIALDVLDDLNATTFEELADRDLYPAEEIAHVLPAVYPVLDRRILPDFPS